MAKQRVTIRENATSTAVNGTTLTVDFVSNVIHLKDNKFWNLNVWFSSLTTGTPTFTVQASNVTDENSFNDIQCAADVNAPNMVESLTSTYSYVRIVYNSNSSTGGNMYFDFYTE